MEVAVVLEYCGFQLAFQEKEGVFFITNYINFAIFPPQNAHSFPNDLKNKKNKHGMTIFLNGEADELKNIHMLQKLITNEFLVQDYFQDYKQYHT